MDPLNSCGDCAGFPTGYKQVYIHRGTQHQPGLKQSPLINEMFTHHVESGHLQLCIGQSDLAEIPSPGALLARHGWQKALGWPQAPSFVDITDRNCCAGMLAFVYMCLNAYSSTGLQRRATASAALRGTGARRKCTRLRLNAHNQC